MSEIKTQLSTRLKEAMKSGEKELVVILRGLSAAIKQVEVDTRKELSDGDISGVFQKELKKLRDARGFAEQQGRQELLEKADREIQVVQSFLGSELSDDELRSEIVKLVDDGAKQIGQIMAGLNANFKGRFDGKLASEIAKELLQ